MQRFVFGCLDRRIEYESKYGIDKKSGWFVNVRGGYYLQFAPWWKAWWAFLFYWWRREADEST